MMNTAHLPTLTAISPHAGRAAALCVSHGPDLTVNGADRVIFAPDPGVLLAHGKGYRVPASLFAALRAALDLEGVSA